MSPTTRQAIVQQVGYISSDSSIVANIQALHDRNVTARDVARIRAHVATLSPQPGSRSSYKIAGPVIGPNEREFVVRNNLRLQCDALHFATMKMFDRLARKHGLTREHVGLHVLYGPQAYAKWRAAQ